MMRKTQFLQATAFSLLAALAAVTACSTQDGPSKGGHNAATAEGQTCGGCEVEGDLQFDDSGNLIGYCDSCEDPLPSTPPLPPAEPTPTPTTDTTTVPTADISVFSARPDGNKTKTQCDKEYWEGKKACDDEESACTKKCDQDHANDALNCLQEKCGTTSPTHYCVVQNRNYCTQKKLDALQACVKDCRDEGSRCRQSVWIDWSACYRDASNRVSAIMRWINPFK